MKHTDIWLSSQNVPCNSQRSTDCTLQQRTSFHHTLDRHSCYPNHTLKRCSPLYHLSHSYVFPCSPGLTACPWQLLSERKQNDKTINKIHFSFIFIIIIVIFFFFFFFFFSFFFFTPYCSLQKDKDTVRKYTNICGSKFKIATCFGCTNQPTSGHMFQRGKKKII